MSSYTSAARAPGSATKKLACFSETTAPPTRAPLQPGGFDQAARGVAVGIREHRPRVLPAGLVLAPPAHDLVDPRRDRGRLVGAAREGRGHHDRRGRDGRAAVAEPELGRREVARPGVGEVEHARPDDHVGGLRAVPAGVHPHRPADRSRDPDEELEPGDAGGRRAPGEHRERHRAAGPHVDLGPARVGREAGSTSSCSNSPASAIPTPAKPVVGHEQVRAAPDHEHREARSPATAPASA